MALYKTNNSKKKMWELNAQLLGCIGNLIYRIPVRAPTTSRAQLHHSTILSALGPDHALTVLFLGTPMKTSQWVTHHRIALVRTPSELPKSLALGRDETIHIRLRGSTPLGDVGCYNPPPLRARHPRRHTSGQGLALIPNCHIPTQAPTTSRARLHCITILSALGPDHALTVLFLGTHMRTSQWVTHHRIALARTCLTSEFR
ncbi:unnamed protein product [Malus baccata var. baccata]